MPKCPHERTAHSDDDGSEILKPRRRKGVHKTNLERLEEQVKEQIEQSPKQYQATDNDLPISLWEEPEL